MRKIAIVFPGVGYNKDRPLLYYTGKLAKQCGYELVHLDFSGLNWSKEALKDREFLIRIVDVCIQKTEAGLERFGDISGDELVFISKSIGTVVANAYAERKFLQAKQICYSPLPMIREFVREEGAILFCGDADPYAKFEDLEEIAKEKRLEIHTIHGGNHSLETGDLETDLDNMKDILKCVKKMLGIS